MTTEQAVNFAISTIKEVKSKMILGGFAEPKEVHEACVQLAKRLKMDFNQVVEIFQLF
jgi:hypothetical protein